jgi:hypothetical protein
MILTTVIKLLKHAASADLENVNVFQISKTFSNFYERKSKNFFIEECCYV